MVDQKWKAFPRHRNFKAVTKDGSASLTPRGAPSQIDLARVLPRKSFAKMEKSSRRSILRQQCQLD